MVQSQGRLAASPADSCASEINATLARVKEELDAHPALKSQVDFVVSRKGDSTGVGKILAYQGPDADTVILLNNYRQMWTMEPWSFVSFGTSNVPTSAHPVVQAALHCLSSEEHDAWAIILRRCHCVVLSMVQKHYQMTPEDVATHLESLPVPYRVPHRGGTLLNKIKSFLSAGSKYEWLEGSLGRGVIFVLGTTICNDTWELRLRKYSKGGNSTAALEHLKSTGIGTLAAQHLDLRNSIIHWMLTQVLAVAMLPMEARALAQRIMYVDAVDVSANNLWAESMQLCYLDTGHFNW